MSEKTKPTIKIINSITLHTSGGIAKVHVIAVTEGGRITEGVQIERSNGAKRTAWGFTPSMGVLSVIDPDGAEKRLNEIRAVVDDDDVADAMNEPSAAESIREEIVAGWLAGKVQLPS